MQVGDVEYVASQPWPFPSSLMLGFRAVARTHDITLRDGELEDARWFTRADIAAGHPALPPPGAISARLIDALVRQRRRTAAPLVAADVFVSPGLAQPSALPPRGRARIAMNSTRGPQRRSRPGPTSPASSAGATCRPNGAWFAVDARRRFGIVTNFREFGRRRRSAPSRGGLIPAYLAGDQRARRIPARARDRCAGLRGLQPAARRPRFALVRLESRRPVRARAAARASTGFPTNSSTLPGRSWCACGRASTHCCSRPSRAGPRRAVDADLFAMLADRETAPPDSLPPGDLSPEWARKLSAPFVLDPSLWHTLLDGPHNLERRRAARSPNAASTPTARRPGQSEHVLNAADER